MIAEHFPAQMIGRASTTLTLVMFLLIFLFQIAIGAVLSHWPRVDAPLSGGRAFERLGGADRAAGCGRGMVFLACGAEADRFERNLREAVSLPVKIACSAAYGRTTKYRFARLGEHPGFTGVPASTSYTELEVTRVSLVQKHP